MRFEEGYTMNKAVIGIVQTMPQAETIVSSLQKAGFPSQEISVLFPNKSGTKDFAHEHHTKAPEGAIGGAGAGGVLGGTLGLLAGIGALAIPGLGPFIAAGPLLAALSGAAAGATVGGIAGALVGLGIPEIEAKIYEGKIRGGNLLIAVHSPDAELRKRADEILKANGAQDISTVREASVPKDEPVSSRVGRHA
jgi:hypothetical protein